MPPAWSAPSHVEPTLTPMHTDHTSVVITHLVRDMMKRTHVLKTVEEKQVLFIEFPHSKLHPGPHFFPYTVKLAHYPRNYDPPLSALPERREPCFRSNSSLGLAHVGTLDSIPNNQVSSVGSGFNLLVESDRICVRSWSEDLYLHSSKSRNDRNETMGWILDLICSWAAAVSEPAAAAAAFAAAGQKVTPRQCPASVPGTRASA